MTAPTHCPACLGALVAGGCTFCGDVGESDALPWSREWTPECGLVGADDAVVDCDDELREAIDARLAADVAAQMRPRRTRTLLQRRVFAVGCAS